MTHAQLLAQYSPLVLKIAGAFQRKLPRNVLREDLVAAGMVGLWDAIQKRDARLSNFEWYASVRIRGAILDELRTQDWLPRRARSRASATHGVPAVVRFDDVSDFEQNKALAEASTSEALTVAKEAQETILAAINTLPERERFIVAQHYFKGIPFKVIAQELNVSEPRISQLHSRAMAKLRKEASLFVDALV